MDKHCTDNTLRMALAGHGPAGVELLWDRYAHDLLAYLRSFLCSAHDAEDVLQSVVVTIVRKRHQLARARRLDAYVYRIARNEVINWMRRHRRREVLTPQEDLWLDASAGPASCARSW